MTQAFSRNESFLNGYYAPLHLEGDASHLPISGSLPLELEGTLYRIGPNPQFAPRGRYDWFAGDGMVHAFSLSQGRASYRNRYVRTPKWELEHAVGEGLASGSLAPSPLDDPRLTELHSTVANTNIVQHAGHLMALEEAHAPFEIEAGSLQPKGYRTYGGDLVGAMTAHPKIDPATGEMIAFGYQTAGFGSRDLRLHVIDAQGQLRRSEHFMAPMASMLHDFCPTAQHIVLPVFPLTASIERAQSGLPAWAWEPKLGTHIGIMRRDGTAADMRWFRGDACFVFHALNAYDTPDGKVVCDMAKYDVPLGFPLANGAPAHAQQSGARLVRWTFDMNSPSDHYTEESLSDVMLEFPRLDERFALRPHRHGWGVSGSINPNVAEPTDRSCIAHIDTMARSTALWRPEAGDYCGEPVFVPRHLTADEGDGWLLTVVYRGAEQRSDLVVLDALHVASGPVATVHLSHRVPAGFHSNWYPTPR